MCDITRSVVLSRTEIDEEDENLMSYSSFSNNKTT